LKVEGEATSGQGPAEARAQRREDAARDALRTLLRDEAQAALGHGPLPDGETELTLRLMARPAQGWDLRFDPPLSLQVSAVLARLRAERAAFQEGRVFCFRCGQAQCEHAAPRSSLAVFAGYSAVGQPEWRDLVQVAVDAGDPRAASLYAEAPAVLAFVQAGRDLRRHQLPAFGRATRQYAILGQVVAGYLPLGRFALPIGAETDRTALTVQAVQTADETGRTRLRLNAIAAGLTSDQWLELGASPWRPDLFRALAQAGRAVTSLDTQLDGARETGLGSLLARVPAVLSRLARGLEQDARRATVRTQHAEARREGRRPVHTAWADALAAPAERLYRDEKHGTWVACGRQGRAHVFSAEGRHVTSFVLPPDGAAFRVRTGRWRGLTPEEAEALRTALRARRGPGRPPAADEQDQP
jgi:hypothetical protein